ncbi:dual specificity protein phosphatase 23-like isoform X2 [Anthonomus grandis grandis]|uniref:dual specificity protein phosphatase 23-like isoform X2 n=1 Tax=Anthonomus grandis grandis TaxID=2921223 RepID=UPI0021667734|nr:dual specificity protein phosphatase 23-like isoform X2 [Anthonomus grandis grandis]
MEGMSQPPAACTDKIKAKEPWNFSWIIPTYLAATSCPSTLEELKFIKEQGISHLVTLSPEYHPPTKNYPGIKWTYIPINEFEAPSLEDIKKFIHISDEYRSKKEAIAIHCRAGRGRTGTMAACYLVHFYNLAPETSISKIRLMRPGSVETYSQEKAVATYRDYLRSI